MAARTHTRTHPPAPGIGTRLPWWAVALPMLAFAVLLLLIAGPGEAQAAPGDPAVTHLVERVRHTLSH
ncbi:hypothetical protein [Streptomyces sp. NPDC054887]